MLLPFYLSDCVEAGCDEAGRGCLAGDVYAAAVVLPHDYENSRLNDSKQISERVRYELRDEIMRDAVAWGVAKATSKEIDKINILNASILAMHRAIDKVNEQLAEKGMETVQHIIVDGNRFKPYGKTPHVTVVKGDGKYLSIAAASILAKTFRDDDMMTKHYEYPQYGWGSNKGYPTVAHRKAIEEHGVTPYHRMSFQLIDPQLSLDL